MNTKLILTITVLFLASTMCWAVENPNVSSSFKAQNAPTRSGQPQRFITQDNPYGKTGNDIVTGNVGGSKHFRGVVPYGSSYYNSGYARTRGSAAVNNFIRRSANPIANDRNPGQTRAYYDPHRTVSSMRRPDGTGRLSNPQLAAQGRTTNPYIVPSPTQTVTMPPYQRPLSTNNMDLDLILARQEQLRQEAKKQADSLKKEPGGKMGFFDEPLTPELIKQKQEGTQEQATDAAIEKDALSKLLAENQKTIDEQIIAEPAEGDAESDTSGEAQPADRTSPESDLVPRPDIKALANEGRKVLGEHETFASLADEKFANFMDAAEVFIEKEQFYKAADAYALAIIWKPEDARGYLGQSFSLFAAGEYMSSAYYLSRAFELNPEAATKQYDLDKFVDNRDVFESRIQEITTWQQRSGSGELAFLLAYLSYQDNKAVQAVNQIRKAKEAMPDEPSVILLKNIIDPEEGLK
ncbi:MAG: hypothetical protein ABFR90_05135 [Planctomycetota bacterium]